MAIQDLAEPRSSARRQLGTLPTLEMVARQAEVSPSTVSRILNGTAKVSEEKRRVVERVIAELGFRPNPLARSLAGGRTMSVGVLTQYMDSPFYAEAVRGIEDVLDASGYISIVTSGHWDLHQEERRLQSLVERKVDGLIILTSQLSDESLRTMADQVPLVVTGRTLQAPHLNSISFDNYDSGRVAMEHLLSLGHRTVAVLTGPEDHGDSTERLSGILESASLRELSIPEELIICGDYHEAGGYQATRWLLKSKHVFSGLIALNDQMAYGAMLALSQAGLRVPDDVSIVGMDNLIHSSYTTPPLTSVSQPIYQIGKDAAHLLLGEIAPEHSIQVKNRLQKPVLHHRESTRRL